MDFLLQLSRFMLQINYMTSPFSFHVENSCVSNYRCTQQEYLKFVSQEDPVHDGLNSAVKAV